MPNHVTNILTINGTPDQVAAVRAAIACAGEHPGPIDFERIVPMPPELHVTSDGLVAYLESRFRMRDTVESLLEALKKADGDQFENFIKALRNVKAHGFACWYDWACEKWGTKWNAYSQREIEPNQIAFDTAWATPTPIFIALSDRFPDVEFDVRFADEDIGHNCGRDSYKAGVGIAVVRFGGHSSEESKRFACQVKGEDYDAWLREREE